MEYVERDNVDKIDNLGKEFLEILLSGIKDEEKDKFKDSMKELFQKIIIKSINEEKSSETKESLSIGGNRFVKFIEISEEGKRPIIYIDTTMINSVICYNNTVAIRTNILSYPIYKVEGSLEEVLNKLEDKEL